MAPSAPVLSRFAPSKHRSGLFLPGHAVARRLPVFPIMGGAMSAQMRAPRGGGQQAQQPAVPFVRGSREFTEGPFIDSTLTPGAAAQSVNPVDIPSRGWAAGLVLQVEATGGVLGAGVLGEDWPFSLFDQLQVTRPNGDPYYGPLQGWSAFITNLYGGYDFESDPRANPDFLSGINCRFLLRIPMEITHHDAYGALINQDAAAAYKLSWTLPASTVLFTTAVTTIPAVRVRAHLEGWEQPPPVDLAGRPVEQAPPGTPTAQFWSEQVFPVNAGLNTIRLTDVGNLMRTLVFIYRDNTAVRVRRDDELPADSIRLTYDARDLENRTLRGWRDAMFKRVGFAAPSGVISYDKTHDGEGHSGNETRNQYLPTSDATRIELIGTFGGDGGVLNVLTNDVAPAGVQVA
jgi:hypothetical protein